MPKRPLTTFLLCFDLVALSGVALFVCGNATGAFGSIEYVGAGYTGARYVSPGLELLIAGVVVFLIEALILGIVAARRGVLEWLTGYAGVVLGTMPFVVLQDYVGSCAGTSGNCTPPTVGDLLSAAVGGAVLAAPVAGALFLAAGFLVLVSRVLRYLTTPPPVPPEFFGGGERG